MLFAERDEEGALVAVHQGCRKEGLEPTTLLDGEILSFLLSSGEKGGHSQNMALSDFSIIRVLEDLIDLLIDKKLILLTELPEEAQEKIRLRQNIRRSKDQTQIMVDDIL